MMHIVRSTHLINSVVHVAANEHASQVERLVLLLAVQRPLQVHHLVQVMEQPVAHRVPAVNHSI